MKKIILVLIVGFFSHAAPAFAIEAHICSSARLASGASMSGADALSDDTKFNCTGLGEVTIPKLAKAGWQVNQIIQQADMHGSFWQILIQK